VVAGWCPRLICTPHLLSPSLPSPSYIPFSASATPLARDLDTLLSTETLGNRPTCHNTRIQTVATACPTIKAANKHSSLSGRTGKPFLPPCRRRTTTPPVSLPSTRLRRTRQLHEVSLLMHCRTADTQLLATLHPTPGPTPRLPHRQHCIPSMRRRSRVWTRRRLNRTW
jgi:hypothetical protein